MVLNQNPANKAPEDEGCFICCKLATWYDPILGQEYCDEHAPDDCERIEDEP